MIGISVSFCVRDIVTREVAIDQVEKIVGGTSCSDSVAWNRCIETYRKSYWRDSPDECEAVLRKLLAEGKIFQPRLENGKYPLILNGAHWVDTESEIMWDPREY